MHEPGRRRDAPRPVEEGRLPLRDLVRRRAAEAAHIVRGDEDAAAHCDEDAGSRSTGFLARLAKKIRDNLEIHIKNFRVNVVDARSPDDGKAYKLELVLGSLVATSMDKKSPANDSPSREESQKADTSKTEKVLAIHGFHAALMPYREHVEDLQGIARTAQADAEETLRQTYMAVEPVSLTLYLTIDDNHQLKVPQFLFRLDIDTTAIKFYKAQYCALYRIAAETSLYRGCLEHWYWRPRMPPLKDPRAWFRFAIKCVRSQVHHKRSAAKLGESYTFQYTRYLLAKNWLDSDQEALLRMENHFNAESLAKFRVAAKQMAQVQAAAAEAAKKVKARESWGQWAKSFVASTVADTADLSDLDVEAQRILREAVEAKADAVATLRAEVDAAVRCAAHPALCVRRRQGWLCDTTLNADYMEKDLLKWWDLDELQHVISNRGRAGHDSERSIIVLLREAACFCPISIATTVASTGKDVVKSISSRHILSRTAIAARKQ